MSKIFIHGVKKDANKDEIKKAITQVFLSSTDNLAWLKPGDKVLLKPALNSSDPFPSTTDPLVIETLHDLITNQGGQVIIGDQSGVEYVMQTPQKTTGDTQDNFNKSGMGQLGKFNFKAFEKEPWEEGFYCFKSPQTTAWPHGFFVSSWIKKVDHIINLPRMSTHTQAGVTLGFKNLVGLLRTDSRLEFHASGPYYHFIKSRVPHQTLKTDYPDQHDFWEKITQIYLSVQDKTRLTLFSGRRVQTTFGPDRKVISIFKSHVHTPETGLIFASSDPVAAEVLAIDLIKKYYAQLNPPRTALYRLALKINNRADKIDIDNPWNHQFIKAALKLDLGDSLFEPVIDASAIDYEQEILKLKHIN